jgi:hypothetical protein
MALNDKRLQLPRQEIEVRPVQAEDDQDTAISIEVHAS